MAITMVGTMVEAIIMVGTMVEAIIMVGTIFEAITMAGGGADITDGVERGCIPDERETSR